MLRSPLAHFVALGGVVFALHGAVGRSPARVQSEIAGPAGSAPSPARTIVFDAPRVAGLRASFRAETGRVPSTDEEAALLGRAVDDEILYREALRLIGEKGSEPVRRRLVQLARLLELGPLEDEPGLVREAQRVGLGTNDPVIRRHLVGTMRLALSAPAASEVSPPDPSAWFEIHRERFVAPDRVRLTHVYLSEERRSDPRGDAEAILRDLAAEDVGAARQGALGDPFVAGATLEQTRAGLDRTFGTGFADRIATLPEGRWSGPVPSAFGLHVVFVHAHEPSRTPSYEAVSSRVAHALREEGARDRLERRLTELRRRYRVDTRATSGDDSERPS